MPRLPGAFKKVQGLGAPLDVYPLRNALLLRTGALLFSFLCVGSALLLTGWAAVNAFERYYRHGPAVVWRGLALPLILGLLLLAVGIAAANGAARRWKKTLVIYEGGIAVRSQAGIATCKWVEAASLRIAISERTFSGVRLGTEKKITLVRADGERICFDEDIRGADEALEKIRGWLLPILYERYVPEFEEGHAFVFGPIEIQKDAGVTLKQKTLSWDALQKAAVDQGTLRLSANDSTGKLKQVSVPVAEIPNLDLMLVFIRQIKPAV
jgi:hypothetical protein